LDLGRETGVGLRNVERRLECRYGRDAALSIQSTPGEGTTVVIRLPVEFKMADEKDGVEVAI
jgi:sensor histidine kinase YesM